MKTETLFLIDIHIGEDLTHSIVTDNIFYIEDFKTEQYEDFYTNYVASFEDVKTWHVDDLLYDREEPLSKMEIYELLDSHSVIYGPRIEWSEVEFRKCR